MIDGASCWIGSAICPRISLRTKELLLAASSWAALLLGLIYLTDGPHPLAIPAWILSFVLARVLVSRAKNWNDLSNAQSAVLPPLVAGYMAILSAMLLWPAVAIGTLSCAPAIMDIDPSWGFFGYRYEELTRDEKIPGYWLMVAGAAAAATMLWCVALSLYAKKYPQAVLFGLPPRGRIDDRSRRHLRDVRRPHHTRAPGSDAGLILAFVTR